MQRRGKYFTASEQISLRDNPQTCHTIRLDVTTEYPEPRLVKDGSILISSWGSAADRDLYFSLWTDTELDELERLEYKLRFVKDLKTKMKISTALCKLESAVQKRGGAQLKDS
jgi:hypothetical protein